MRPWRHARVLVAAVACLAVLAGCGAGTRPPGVDGNLTNGWPAMAAATLATPVAGTCYEADFNPYWTRASESRQVPCAGVHKVETIFVGTFTGAPATAATPPTMADRAVAFADCQHRATDFLGGYWGTGYLRVGVASPALGAWRGGARWYACDVMRVDASEKANEIGMSGSARDGLRGARPLARRCVVLTESIYGNDEKEIACDQPHNAEFAGAYPQSGSYLHSASNRYGREGLACRGLFPSLVGVAFGGSRYLGYYWHDITEDDWDLGIRTGECLVAGFDSDGSPNKVRFTGSLKGIGGGKPTGWHT